MLAPYSPLRMVFNNSDADHFQRALNNASMASWPRQDFNDSRNCTCGWVDGPRAYEKSLILLRDTLTMTIISNNEVDIAAWVNSSAYIPSYLRICGYSCILKSCWPCKNVCPHDRPPHFNAMIHVRITLTFLIDAWGQLNVTAHSHNITAKNVTITGCHLPHAAEWFTNWEEVLAKALVRVMPSFSNALSEEWSLPRFSYLSDANNTAMEYRVTNISGYPGDRMEWNIDTRFSWMNATTRVWSYYTDHNEVRRLARPSHEFTSVVEGDPKKRRLDATRFAVSGIYIYILPVRIVVIVTHVMYDLYSV